MAAGDLAFARARRLPSVAEEYALSLEGYGIDIPPAQLAAMAHQAFGELQAEMAPIAAQMHHDIEAALGTHFNQQHFHDFILS